MRYALIGFALLAAACSGAPPTAPTSLTPASSSSLSAGQFTGLRAQSGSGLPFNGDLHATESFDPVHHLVGGGIGSQLGRFSYRADITVDDTTGDGVGTVVWTGANGDQVLASTHGSIAGEIDNGIRIREEQTITGGTGRFSGASGSIIVTRTLDFATGSTSGSYAGTINFGS
jgi:hypothetical protein